MRALHSWPVGALPSWLSPQKSSHFHCLRVRIAGKSIHHKINQLSKMSISFSYCLVSDMKWLGRLMAERGGGSRVDDCGLGLKEAVRGFDDRGLGLEGWLRIAVDGSNRFGRDWWPMGDGSRLRFRVDSLRFRLLLVLWFEGAMEAAKDFCRSGLRLGRKV
ncbi:hypothetical protein BHE74_00031740 [Ensete ventricosum]|nr:hypothetical protein BHE74_00031740 [Ensete ventricosum]